MATFVQMRWVTPKSNDVKLKISYARAEIRTLVVVICGSDFNIISHLET